MTGQQRGWMSVRFRGFESWLDATLAYAGERFMRGWAVVERAYRRPLSRFALRLKFSFYPVLAVAALGWFGWDWTHEQSLNAAENAVFDRVVNWRPVEPVPSGQVVVVEIDECSIEYFRNRGQGGWPWNRQKHADLLDKLDRAGVALVGYDILFADPAQEDRPGDGVLDDIARGGEGRFLFVLGHEISHCVQRDHYNVIRKQQLTALGQQTVSNSITTGTSTAEIYARDYVEQQGATIMLTALDRDAEFRADAGAEIYLSRSGMNPMALYAVLQKMMALGAQSASLAALYKTHPTLDARLDQIDRRNYKGLVAYTSRE